jgi:hypothetical protein
MKLHRWLRERLACVAIPSKRNLRASVASLVLCTVWFFSACLAPNQSSLEETAAKRYAIEELKWRTAVVHSKTREGSIWIMGVAETKSSQGGAIIWVAADGAVIKCQLTH